MNANGKEEIGTSPGQNPPRTAQHRHIGNFERIHPEGDSSTGRLHSLVEPDDDGELPDVVGEASCEEGNGEGSALNCGRGNGEGTGKTNR